MRVRLYQGLHLSVVLAGMAVTVTDGVAHLWGSIDTEECKRAARVAAESVRGVTRVVEHFSGDRP